MRLAFIREQGEYRAGLVEGMLGKLGKLLVPSVEGAWGSLAASHRLPTLCLFPAALIAALSVPGLLAKSPNRITSHFPMG